MRKELTKQTLKLRLLALVLALALIWYSLNPVPRPITRIKREDEPPDEKKRNVETQSMTTNLLIAFRPWEKTVEGFTPPDEDMDDFEWPEFIDG